jgi:hypothetical protein
MQKFMHGLNKEQKTIKLISNEKSNKLYINDSLDSIAANDADTRFRKE